MRVTSFCTCTAVVIESKSTPRLEYGMLATHPVGCRVPGPLPVVMDDFHRKLGIFPALFNFAGGFSSHRFGCSVPIGVLVVVVMVYGGDVGSGGG